MRAMLEAHGLESDFEIEQRDSCTLRCRHCGETLPAGTADLHLQTCEDYQA